MAESTEEVVNFILNSSDGLPSILSEPITFLTLIGKFLLAGLGLYALYLIVMLILSLRRNSRLKRMEVKIDLIMKKLKIEDKKLKK